LKWANHLHEGLADHPQGVSQDHPLKGIRILGACIVAPNGDATWLICLRDGGPDRCVLRV